MEQIGKTPAGFVQFLPDNVRRPLAISNLVWLRFFHYLTGGDGTTFLRFRMHICELQSLMCLARNRKNFVRPDFGVTVSPLATARFRLSFTNIASGSPRCVSEVSRSAIPASKFARNRCSAEIARSRFS